MFEKKSPYILSRQGFTLIELIFVVLVIGIIGVMVLPTWTSTSFNLEHEARRVLDDVRYAQALSITSGQRYRWVKVSSTTYQLTNEAGTAVLLPSGSNQLILTSGVTIGTLTNLPNSLIAFNSQGIPYTDSSYPGTALSSAASIPITAGSQTRTIQISPQTGYGILQ